MGSIKSKELFCENKECGRKVSIRTRVITEQGSFKVCGLCAKKMRSGKPMPVSSTVKKRKEDRKGLPDFFIKAVANLRENPFCDNCNAPININLHPVNNIAHILPKEKYKSVMDNDENYVLLCSSKDLQGNSCHEKFDHEPRQRISMSVWPQVVKKFLLFKQEVKERGSIYLDLINSIDDDVH